MKQIYFTLFLFSFLSLVGQDSKLFDYQWKLTKIVTNSQTYIAAPYTDSGDPNTAVYEQIVFSDYNGVFSFTFGYYGNGTGYGLTFDDLNSSFQIPEFSNHFGGYTPSEAFFSEEFVYLDPNQMTIENPFSYDFSYDDDVIYLEITNGAGSVATFFDDFTNSSQITFIPDQNFEQSLINQSIDSDGSLNGQVFTSDISGLTTFSLIYSYIEDLTGLEDFAALEHLTLDNIYIYDYSATNNSLDLSSNTNLETFTMYGGGDNITNNVFEIILNNNPNINTIDVPDNWMLRQLDLKTGTTDASNLDIDIHIIPFDFWEGSVEEFNNNLFCIKVTDPAAATAGTGVYSTWTINATDNPYYFSETCALSTDRFKDVQVSIYPNPATEILNIETKNFQFNTIKIFNLQGQAVKILNDSSAKTINVSELANGIYVIHMESDHGIVRKKFFKL